MKLNLYLSAEKAFSSDLFLNENMEKRYCRLLMLYDPRVETYLTEGFNAEEYLLFCSKIKRLETNRDIVQKCQKNIYPNDWIYDFGPAINSNAFLKRYRILWSRVRKQYDERKSIFHFSEVVDQTNIIVKRMRNSFAEDRKIQENLIKLEDWLSRSDIPKPQRKKMNAQYQRLLLQKEFYGYNDPVYQDLMHLFEWIATWNHDAIVFLQYFIGESDIYDFKSRIRYSQDFFAWRNGHPYVDFRKVLWHFDCVPLLLGYFVSDFPRQNESLLQEAEIRRSLMISSSTLSATSNRFPIND